MGRTRESQKKIVLEHLLNNEYITSIEAIEKYRITRLSDRIFNLRKEGYNIITTMVTVDTMYGKEEVAKYSLKKENEQ